MELNALLAHPWFGTWLAALIAALSGLLVYRVGGILLLRLTRHAVVLHSMISKARTAARWVLPLVALQMVWQGRG